MPIHQEPKRREEDFGLIGWLESTRIRLPLKGVDCRFEVCGELVSVQLEQVFHNSNHQALNCLYSFPLPGNAAVYRCELQIGGRVISAKVEEQGKAREIYTEKLKEGRRASLVEVERDNLFTLSLGNVQPDDVIVVRFAYFQTVERTGKELSLMIPFCPGERYIPGKPLLRSDCGKGTVRDTNEVPDASRITPPRIDAFHPDAATLSIEGRLQGGRIRSGSLKSPLHLIETQQQRETMLISINPASAVPDRDFVLRWEEQASSTAAIDAWLEQQKYETYALVRLTAPEAVTAVKGASQDHYFLVDRSGSMQGVKWVKTVEALIKFVHLLDENDRVWITFFESKFEDFAERPMRAAELLADPSFLDIESIGVAGGTELLPALKHVLNMVEMHSAARKADVIVITDGQVGNESAVLKELKKNPRLKLHAFGIDTAVNDAFLRNLTRQQHGRLVLQTPEDDLTNAIASLAAKLRRPVVTDIQVSPGWEMADGVLSDLHEGDIVALPLRRVSDHPLKLTGHLPDGTSWNAQPELQAVANPAIPLLWAKQRIELHLDAEKNAEAIALSKQFNIVCRGTAFIAWDASEKVDVASTEVYNPSLEQVACSEMDRCLSAAPVAVSASPAAGSARFGFAPKGSVSAAGDTTFFRKKSRGGGVIASMKKMFMGDAPDPELSVLLEPLLKHPLFNTAKGREFIVELDDWLKQMPVGVIRVMSVIKRMVSDLLKHKDDQAACVQLCRDFAGKEIADEQRRKHLLELADSL